MRDQSHFYYFPSLASCFFCVCLCLLAFLGGHSLFICCAGGAAVMKNSPKEIMKRRERERAAAGPPLESVMRREFMFCVIFYSPRVECSTRGGALSLSSSAGGITYTSSAAVAAASRRPLCTFSLEIHAHVFFSFPRLCPSARR